MAMTAHSLQLDAAEIGTVDSSDDVAPTDGIEPLDRLADWRAGIEEFASGFHADVNEILELLDEWKRSSRPAVAMSPCTASTDPLPINVPAVTAKADPVETRPIPSSIDSDTDRLAALKARLSRQIHSTGHFALEDAPVATKSADSEANPA